MTEEVRTKLNKLLLNFVAIRYVYITKKSGFFILKKAVRDTDHVDANYSADENGRPYFDGWVGSVSEYDDCVLLHKDRLIEGKDTNSYITEYRAIIDKSPDVLIDGISEEGGNKIGSGKYITPVKNLLREIGVLPEKRGKGDKLNDVGKKRNKLIISQYAKLGSPKRIPMKKIQGMWAKEVDEMFPDDKEALEKYGVSDDTIRRIIKSRNKK